MKTDFVWTLPTDPAAEPLILDLAREYDERYGYPSSRELSRYPAEKFSPEHGGAFLLVLRDGVLAAGGAFMKSSDTAAEVKRVWTSAAFRRQGMARIVMAELEREAARRGYTEIELTTGARQPEAVALYLSLGYRPLFDLDADWEEISYLPFAKAI